MVNWFQKQVSYTKSGHEQEGLHPFIALPMEAVIQKRHTLMIDPVGGLVKMLIKRIYSVWSNIWRPLTTMTWIKVAVINRNWTCV